MSALHPPAPAPDRGHLRVARLLGVLPDLPGLQPLVERLLATSRTDTERRWTTSGELGTAGDRWVDTHAFEARALRWVEAEQGRLLRRVERVATISRALERGDVDEAVAALLDESGALEEEGAGAEAGRWAEAAARIAHDVGHPRTAEAVRRAARCARAAGNLGNAAQGYEEAWARARDAGQGVDAVIAATGRGNVAVDQGRWIEAERWYRSALDLLAREEPRLTAPTEARALRWRLYQNLGITHRERGALEEADRWYVRAEAEAAPLSDPAAIVEIENGRGQLDLARGAARGAELRFRRALEVLQGEGASEVRVAIRTNLAEALLTQGRTLEAGSVAREAEAEALGGQHFRRLPAVYRLLARVAHERGEREAFVLVEQALHLVRDGGLPPLEEALTLLLYAELRGADGEHEAAQDARSRAARIFAELNVEPSAHGADPQGTEREGDAS